jgi:hypothetical protein
MIRLLFRALSPGGTAVLSAVALLLSVASHAQSRTDRISAAGLVRVWASSPLTVKTNLLYTAALLPNVAVEFPFGGDWSVSMCGAFSKWDSGSPYYQSHQINYAGAEFRYWWRPAPDAPYLNGWFAGIYYKEGIYDLRLFPKQSIESLGYLSRRTWSTGLSGGYSMPLSPRWNLEFGLHAGYLTGGYHAYNRSRCRDCYPERKTGALRWFGPTGAGVSLAYRIGMDSKKKTGEENK